MINYVLFDDSARDLLLPFTHTRPAADIRCGILTNRERWELLLGQSTSTLTVSYLNKVFPISQGVDFVFINGAFLATSGLAQQIQSLATGQCLFVGGCLLAARLNDRPGSLDQLNESTKNGTVVPFSDALRHLEQPWDIFRLNGPQLIDDFHLITNGRKSAQLPPHVLCAGVENLFIEPGAEIGMGTIINAAKGPVYIGRDVHILEGALIHGPFAAGEQSVVKMGAKIYGDTTIGPGCKVGGEVNNVVFFANSNKGHDGYLGNSVVGEWCNIGADTNTSNLKNNYDVVKVHREHTGKLHSTGLIFCGLMMGDHSKCGINTMFNTGTVVGVSVNIFGGGFPPKFIPSFSWGGADGLETYQFDKALETAVRMMERRHRRLSEADIAMLRHIFEHTSAQR